MPAATTSGSADCSALAQRPRRAGGPGRGARLARGRLRRADPAPCRRRDRAPARHRPRRPRGAAGEEDRAGRRRPGADDCWRGLGRGRERLADAFGDAFRAGARAALEPDRRRPGRRALPAPGFAGLSTFGPRRAAEAAPGLRRVNTHLDLVVWRDGRRPLTLARGCTDRLAELRARHGDEPIGILSHHRSWTPAAFATLDRLLALVQDQPRATLATRGQPCSGRADDRAAAGDPRPARHLRRRRGRGRGRGRRVARRPAQPHRGRGRRERLRQDRDLAGGPGHPPRQRPDHRRLDLVQRPAAPGERRRPRRRCRRTAPSAGRSAAAGSRSSSRSR